MTKTWVTRVWEYLSLYEDVPALIVATPLVPDEVPPKPLTIVVPPQHETAVLEKISEPHPGSGKKALVVEGKGRKRSVRKPRKKAAAKRKKLKW